MEKLVFINSNNLNEDPFTTSKIIGEYGEVQHHTVTRLIRDYEKDLKIFGVLGFEIHKPKSSKGGRPEKIYKLNEQQATLLITYMQNTLPVRNFKINLVKQFYSMREDLFKRRIERSNGKVQRNSLTEAINNLPDGKYKDHLYSNCTNLIYKKLFNKNARQLQDHFGINKKDNLRDYLSKQELSNVKALEDDIAHAITLGFSYKEIKLKIQLK